MHEKRKSRALKENIARFRNGGAGLVNPPGVKPRTRPWTQQEIEARRAYLRRYAERLRTYSNA